VQNGGIVHISGTVATSALTMFTGQTVTLIADAAWPLTYNATTMKIADGASYTCTAGNVLLANKDVGGVINLIILSGGNNIKKPGDIFVYSGTTAPAGAMAVPVAAADVSRAIYAALFAAIGTTWGVGVGGLTFGIPFVPADYAILQANGNVGTISVGSVISHLHGGGLFRAGSALTMSSTAGAVHGQGSTDAAGGAANLAAGVRFLLCLQYQ
jgi:microcystin-dependent protein